MCGYRVKRKEIRFAVGEAGNQASPIWRLWCRKSDVYLTARTLGGFFKISMHAPNAQHPAEAWIAANTSESGVDLKVRRMKRWDRPAEVTKGWTWGPRIAVPMVAALEDLRIDENVAKPVEWKPAPVAGTKATISLIFAGPEVTANDVEEVCREKGYLHLTDYLERDNLEKVFVALSYDPLTKPDYLYIAQLEAEAKQIIDSANDDVKGFLFHCAQELEAPFICAIKFGTSREGPW
jgi:hypothetical protein